MTQEESSVTVERNQRRRKPANNNKTNSDQKKNKKVDKEKSKSKGRGNQKKKSIKKTGVNDYKYQEINKLVKTIKPVTINGIPLQEVIDRIIKEDTNDSNSETERTSGNSREPTPIEVGSKKLSKKAKNELLSKFLLNYFAKDNCAPIYLSFMIKPSDPDFPYDLDNLKISLCVPGGYPYNKDDKPTIMVLNEEIPKGFSVNIEIGFKRIVRIAMLNEPDEEIALVNGKGLLSQIQTLDKYLELFLKQERKETIKIIKYRKSASPNPESNKKENKEAQKEKKEKSKDKRNETFNNISAEVLEYREQLVTELLNKKLDISLFKKGRNESRYRISIPIFKEDNSIPEIWRLEKKVDLILTIPISYPRSQMKIVVAENYSKNMILKHQKHDTYSSVKKSEMYLVNNFNVYNFKTDSILVKMNFLANNLRLFCLEFKEFAEYTQLVTKLFN